ncbi:hypothetical protein [Terrarubrum flagellatum]|uniref:MotE family protein n=1 Tax=Terrirubrum flagellatum TaxID=2895980 RepID=UPI0031450665
MKGFRIFPAVAGAAACLLALKGLALVREATTEPPQVLLPGEVPSFGRAIARARQGYIPPDPDITGSAPPKKKEEEKKPEPAQPPAPPAGKPVNLDTPNSSNAERAILERLGQRREEIEGRAREMDTREQLLRAAEQKLDTRVNDLKQLEEKMQSAPENRDQSQTQALKNLVTMYETMKPKEAARVFERLDHKVLIPVVQKMNPRKMAEVLAAMSPESAEKLTVALATRNDAPESALGSANELPRLDVAPRPAPASPRQ